MLRLIAGLSRSLPLVIALVVLAVIVYMVVSWLRSPVRAKEVLIKMFLIICAAITIVFALISLYAIADGNVAVLELAASCAGVGVVGLFIVLICRHVFRKNHPNYAYEATVKAEPVTNKPDVLNIVTKILNYINDNRRK